MPIDSPPPLHRTLPANTLGRDFVVGDLHGSYALLMQKLQKVGFDFSKDRLISVGDLVDRGPDSLKCLELLTQPWFFAVLGNHEAMFLQYMGIRTNFYSSPRDFIPNGGDWLLRLNDAQLTVAQTLGEAFVVNLPLRLTVEHPAGDFDVVHAQFFDYTGPISENQPYDENIEHCCTWGRFLIQHALRSLPEPVRNTMPARGTKSVFSIEPVMLPDRRLTYVGHTIVPVPILTHSHFFLDTGGYHRELGQAHFDLCLVQHGSNQIY